MLVEILDHLTPADRREASLVNRLFYDACQHPRFIKDRHLHFNYCELAYNVPPVAVLMRSERTYSSMTLGYFDCDKPIDDFWLRMGKTVEYLEFNGFCDFGMYLPAVLNRFTALKTLKLDVEFEFGTKYKCILPKMEKLILTFNVHGHCEDENELVHYDNLLATMPKLNYIELIVYTGSYDALVQFLTKYPTKIKALTFQMLPDDTSSLVNTIGCIMKMRKIQLEKLCITYFNNWPLIDELLEKQVELSHFELGTSDFPTKKYLNVKRFEISINKSVKSFESLSNLGNLKTLIVLGSYGETNCFFGHKKITNTNLTELQLLDLKDRVCLECFKAMICSYPNLQIFHSYGNQLENEHVAIILRHAIKLKDLNVLDHTQVTEDFIYKTPSIADVQLLEKLDISGAFCLPNRALMKWPKMFNLREIGFGKIFDVSINCFYLILIFKNYRTSPNIIEFKN